MTAWCTIVVLLVHISTILLWNILVHQFVNFRFEFPGINTIEQPIVVIYNTSAYAYANNLLKEMKKIGINFNSNHILNVATGSITYSHINVYWNSDYTIGINPESDIIKAIKILDMRIPIHIVSSNEYIKTSGPKIEIVLGSDYRSYFTFSKPVEYLPKIETILPTEKNMSGSIVS